MTVGMHAAGKAAEFANLDITRQDDPEPICPQIDPAVGSNSQRADAFWVMHRYLSGDGLPRGEVRQTCEALCRIR